MKKFYPNYLLLISAFMLWVSFSATAQRTDSLMTKADVIAPNITATTLNGFTYYLADDGNTGYELWRTDGTKAGTKLVKDIRPGKASAFVSDSSFYYFGRDANSSSYVFTAQRVKDALRAFRPFVHPATNTLYFWADNGTNGIELWKSDGTEAGTQMVIDLIPGPFSSGTQYDLLSGGGYLGGTNGGYTNYATTTPNYFVTKDNKLLFWTSNISNVVFETDGTASGTRDINYQAVKYVSSSNYAPVIVNGRTFIETSVYNKGKYYYSLIQDNGKNTTPTPLITNSESFVTVLTADKRGLVYGVNNSADASSKQYTYTIFRRDSVTAKVNTLKAISFAKLTTGSRSQGVSTMGRTATEVWLNPYDNTPSQQSGKNISEVWRVDLATDSVQLVRRFEATLTYSNNVTRIEKGSERLWAYSNAPNGYLLVSASADSASTAYNRYTALNYDTRAGKLQIVQDSLFNWSFLQSGKMLMYSRPTIKNPVQVSLTDGRTKQPIKTLGAYETAFGIYATDAGPVVVGYNGYKDKANKTLYKVDVWKVDSTATGTTIVGKANAFPGGVGAVFSNGGNVYSNYGTLLKLSTPDSIHYLADIGNYSTYVLDGNYLGIYNGRLLSEVNGTLLAIDPQATPRKCLIGYSSLTKAATSYNTKDLGYCPARDSLITLRQGTANYNASTGEISRIYYKNYTWLRDSTILQSGTADSLKLRQQGQYPLTLRGTADGCVANDTWQVYFSNPTVSQIPRLSNDNSRKTLAAIISGGYPINGSSGYYNGKWERTATDGAISQASTETNFNAANGYRSINTAALDELVNNIAQPKYGTYTLKITDANSCSATGTFVYDDKTTILGVTATLSVRNGSEICAGTPVSYTATTTGGKAPYTYRWLLNGTPVSGNIGASGTVPINNTLVTTDFSGYFSIEATDADGKKTYSGESLYFVKAAPIISLTATSLTIPTGQSVVITANCSNYQYPTFAWAKDGAVIAGVASKSLAATQAGLYSVTVGSGTTQGCKAVASLRIGTGNGRVAASTAAEPVTRNRQSLYIENGLDEDAKARPTMKIMPNPSEGPTRVLLQLPEPVAVKGQIIDTQGRVIHRWEEPKPMSAVDTTIDLSPQPVGAYVIQVEAGGQVHSQKVIKK